jgi:hypothetical protein
MHYSIYDNGDEPFDVSDDGQQVIVYKQEFVTETADFGRSEKLLEIPYTKIFIGDNDLCLPRYLAKGDAKGNSILLQVSNTYLFIGYKIFTFEVEEGDEIVSYYSPVGNNSVPYPYAIGKKNTYLLIEEVYVPNDVLDLSLSLDVYAQYYGFIAGKQSLKAHGRSMGIQVLIKRQW